MGDTRERLSGMLESCPFIVQAWACTYEEAAEDLISKGVRLETKQATKRATSDSVNECEYCLDEFCVNAECPMCADYCPVVDYPGVCRYEDRERRG